jgi:leader peptidase (prepilin peptidase)/N-methyltransferase
MPDPAVPLWYLYGVTAALGLILGSFLNVVIHRLPREMSLIRPPSHCPACGRPVRWFDNLPLLSWVLLGGRCRSCRAAIPIRYPLVELAAAVLLVAMIVRFGLTRRGAEAAVLSLLLLALAVIDFEHHLLPDWLTLPGIAVGLGWSFAGGLATPRAAVVGAVLGAAIPLLVIVVYRWVRGVEGMGLGDVKLLAMIGAFLGWRGVLLSLVLGATAGAAVGIGLIASARGSRDTELPFGTFLCAGAMPALMWGEALAGALGWTVAP